MVEQQNNQQGFSVVIALVAILIIAGVGLGGWYVLSQNDDAKKGSTSQDTDKPDADKQKDKATQPDLYEGWETCKNSKYGITLRYPTEWKLGHEGEQTPSEGLMNRQLFSMNLERDEEVKYNTTFVVEVLDLAFDDAVEAYDPDPQSTSDKVTKETKQLKGRQSVQYFVNDSDPKRTFLINAGSKTYLVESINGWLNADSDADYWAKFDKTLESLELSI